MQLSTQDYEEIFDTGRKAVLAQFPTVFKPDAKDIRVVVNDNGVDVFADLDWAGLFWRMKVENTWTGAFGSMKLGWVFRSWIIKPNVDSLQFAVDSHLSKVRATAPAQAPKPPAKGESPLIKWQKFCDGLTEIPLKGTRCYMCFVGVGNVMAHLAVSGTPMCNTCIERHIKPVIVGDLPESR